MTVTEQQLFEQQEAETPAPWWRGRMCGLDIETTRPTWDGDRPDVNEERIVSAAVALVGGGHETWSHSWLVNPGFEIPPESTAIHGIHNEDVADAPPIAQVIPDLLDVLWEAVEQRIPLVVYNAPYDCTVVDREARRVLMPSDPMALTWQSLRVVDPMVLDRMLDTFRKGSRKLPDTTAIWNARAKRIVEARGEQWKAGDLLKRPLRGAHEAAADAIATCRLAWLLAAFGDVYTRGRPVPSFGTGGGPYESGGADRDMVERQREWNRARNDLDYLHEWQRRWRWEDQVRLRELWRSQDNPRWEDVRPEWPLYPTTPYVEGS